MVDVHISKSTVGMYFIVPFSNHVSMPCNAQYSFRSNVVSRLSCKLGSCHEREKRFKRLFYLSYLCGFLACSS